MKYLTMRDNETIKEFQWRVKFEVKGKLYTQSISDPMGKGIRVMTLVNDTLSKTVKIEVDMYNVDKMLEEYPFLYMKEKAVIPKRRRSDELGNIEDLYK